LSGGCERRWLRTFQFHYGTIKSRKALRHFFITELFQFHYGTIKSFYGFFPDGSEEYFNSIMVRLKEAIFNDLVESYHYFNSIMVRLKGFAYEDLSAQNFISIPLWYD